MPFFQTGTHALEIAYTARWGVPGGGGPPLGVAAPARIALAASWGPGAARRQPDPLGRVSCHAVGRGGDGSPGEPIDAGSGWSCDRVAGTRLGLLDLVVAPGTYGRALVTPPSSGRVIPVGWSPRVIPVGRSAGAGTIRAAGTTAA